MRELFRDRLVLVLFLIERDTDYTVDLETWCSFVRRHSSLDPRTIRGWVATKGSSEPNNGPARDIYKGTKAYYEEACKKSGKKSGEAEKWLDRFISSSAVDLASTSRISETRLIELIPEARLFAAALAPKNPVRDIYAGVRVKNSAIKEMEKDLVGRKLIAYRSDAVKGSVHRDMVTFEADRDRRVLATWRHSQTKEPYKGYFYCSGSRIFGSLTKSAGAADFEMAFMCIEWDKDQGLMPGLFLGLTDVGESPCSGRLVVLDATNRDVDQLRPGPVKRWPSKQRKGLMKYFNPKTRVLNGEYSLMCKRDFLRQHVPDVDEFVT